MAAAVAFLSRNLSGSLPYVRHHTTINKNVFCTLCPDITMQHIYIIQFSDHAQFDKDTDHLHVGVTLGFAVWTQTLELHHLKNKSTN